MPDTSNPRLLLRVKRGRLLTQCTRAVDGTGVLTNAGSFNYSQGVSLDWDGWQVRHSRDPYQFHSHTAFLEHTRRELTKLGVLCGNVTAMLEPHVRLARLQPHKEALLWWAGEVAHTLPFTIRNALFFIL